MHKRQKHLALGDLLRPLYEHHLFVKNEMQHWQHQMLDLMIGREPREILARLRSNVLEPNRNS